MTVDVVIPWADGNDEHRERALEYITARYAEQCPDWNIVLGVATTSPWVKARAVQAGLAASTADIVIVADADVWADSTRAAVTAVAAGKRSWAMPHKWVRRLSRAGTADVYAGTRRLNNAPREKREYAAFQGGGIVVLPRAVYDACPLDPRFEGWGHEDESWARALRLLHGRRWVDPDGRLEHLWHPPQPRDGARGAPESWELRERYRRLHQTHDREAMLELVAGAVHALNAA